MDSCRIGPIVAIRFLGGVVKVQSIAVIIPYFQRQPGVLKRALSSVLSQQPPDGWIVEVIVVDDGSPHPAHDEIDDSLDFKQPFFLKLIRQENAGVAEARNRGLDEANSATLIAFLDSDDFWPEDHLARAVAASAQGFDFYFSDHRRQGHHDLICRSPQSIDTTAFIKGSSQKTGFLDIPKDLMIRLTLHEFPCQASTVVYARKMHKDLRFEARLRNAGEDVLFFASLQLFASRICVDLDSFVECGEGVNIYWSNLGWNSERYLSIKVDVLLTHRLVRKRLNLSCSNTRFNNEKVSVCTKEVAFHLIRNLPKNPRQVLREIRRLSLMSPMAAISLPPYAARVVYDRLVIYQIKKLKPNSHKLL